MERSNQSSDFWNKMFSEGRDYQVFNQILLNKIIKDQRVGGEVLDVGCGTGDLVIKLSERGMSVTGLDFSSVAIEKAKQRLASKNISANLILGNIGSINTQFDAIFCKLVYAFINDKENFLRAIKNGLKEGGVFILITPILNEENKNLETKPGICAKTEDIELLRNIFDSTEEYHTNYEDEGRIVKTLICR
jgi:protein-L-isoaspartate(D-aspartate) O-methyltransferase